MNDVMISLIGEQPVPNLLPIRYDQPGQVLLAYTETTKEVSDRLEKVLYGGPRVSYLQVLPFDIPATRRQLEQFVTNRGWRPSEVVFNLTGGTKAMAFAAYGLAEEWRSRFLYLMSEESESRVYRYRFDEDGTALLEQEEVIPGVISLDDYLRAHLGTYYTRGFSPTAGGRFEEIIHRVLQPAVGEIVPGIQHGGALDIDIVLRCANQVGISEVKTGKGSRTSEGLKQLNTAGRREFLGVYAKKFLIVDTAWDHTLSNLRDLADASEINLIELPSYGQTGKLSDQDQRRLVRDVLGVLGHP